MDYIVKKIAIKDLDQRLKRFIADNGDRLNALYSSRFDWQFGFPLKYAIEHHLVLVCYRGEEPIGVMFGSLNTCMFDIRKKLLRQEILFSKYPRATVELLRYFIDFGKANTNYIIACIGKHTNLKQSSLQKLGFTKLEELYILES